MSLFCFFLEEKDQVLGKDTFTASTIEVLYVLFILSSSFIKAACLYSFQMPSGTLHQLLPCQTKKQVEENLRIGWAFPVMPGKIVAEKAQCFKMNSVFIVYY
jgi:hypothetical protein